MTSVTVIGGGLAGCESAWQLAQAGLRVRLLEMKPAVRTPAQVLEHMGELVCSNSLRSSHPTNAVGLLKEEMERLGSLVIRCARETRVPAGDALAVDREAFARAMTEAVRSHGNIEVVLGEVEELPGDTDGPVIVATGPLTGEALAADIGRTVGEDGLYFYDAIAPIVDGGSIDRSVAYFASRYGKGNGDDYLNCPFSREEYEAFLAAVRAAEYMPLHAFEEPRYFEGCLPIEILAQRGDDTLRFGCMKPVGLDDPRTGRRPYAVLQLRREDRDGQAFNLVGCQTKMKYPDQARVFRMVPGLAEATFLRYGAVHRNTYLDSPTVLDERMRLRRQPHLRFAGQMTGVEGYVESAAHGLLTARLLAADLSGQELRPPPRTSALGGLWAHVCGDHRLPGRPHEPQNVNWGQTEPLIGKIPKRLRKQARVDRGRKDFDAWGERYDLSLIPVAESSS